MRRRDVLKLSAAGTLTATSAGVIAKALAAPLPQGATGSIRDVEHVVILMQENRAFDHYYGSLRGVRGFDDPTAIRLPSGQPVWRQTGKTGGLAAPFRLDASATAAEAMGSLDHSWKGSHDRWKHYDAWATAKTPKTMGYFTREDLPFYYALADAFTICDAYHCALFGPTSPNRLYLFSGTSGLTVGQESVLSVKNPGKEEPNNSADRSRDSAWPGFGWTPYAERLEKAGVSWKVYQEYDAYGCNSLAHFPNFRGAGPSSVWSEKGRSWADGSTFDNVATSQGEYLAAAFRKDIESGRLPQVSWIVPTERICEHPKASPALGQNLLAQLISALADNPRVFARTVFILNYDENDGFFDHVPPPVPATRPELGVSMVSTAGETYGDEPVGLGPRVPMIVISPWTKGGFVNSQVFDHTSVLRFLETRFGVMEPNISPWRRAVCGDLTSIFDFSGQDSRPEVLPKTSGLVTRAAANKALAQPVVGPGDAALPRQERGRRLARALPYALTTTGRMTAGGLDLTLNNLGAAGMVLDLRDEDGFTGPWSYTVTAGQTLKASAPTEPGPYNFVLRGPNGYLRGFKGDTDGPQVVVEEVGRAGDGALSLALTNPGRAVIKVTAKGGRYDHGSQRAYRLKPGQTVKDTWALDNTAQWYDLVIALDGHKTFERRLSGHLETGRPSLSDPSIGAA